MKRPVHKFRRGDSSAEHPGKIFLRYGRYEDGRPKEEWVTAAKFGEWKQRFKAYGHAYGRSPAGRKSQRKTYQKQKLRPGHREMVRKQSAKQYSTPIGKLKHCLRSRHRIALKLRGVKKNSKTEQTLGCTFDFFKGYIEAQFRDGMTWENYGKVWNVDHIRPVSAFDLHDPIQLMLAFHYKNCQPLFCQENFNKNDKVDGTNGRFIHPNIIPFKTAA